MNFNFKSAVSGLAKQGLGSIKVPSINPSIDLPTPNISGFDMPSINPSSMLGNVNGAVPDVNSAMPDVNSAINKATSDVSASMNVDPMSLIKG